MGSSRTDAADPKPEVAEVEIDAAKLPFRRSGARLTDETCTETASARDYPFADHALQTSGNLAVAPDVRCPARLRTGSPSHEGTFPPAPPACQALKAAHGIRPGRRFRPGRCPEGRPSLRCLIRPAASADCGRTGRGSRAPRAPCHRRAASASLDRPCRCSDRGSRRPPRCRHQRP